jgi:hypothetical protein
MVDHMMRTFLVVLETAARCSEAAALFCIPTSSD